MKSSAAFSAAFLLGMLASACSKSSGLPTDGGGSGGAGGAQGDGPAGKDGNAGGTGGKAGSGGGTGGGSGGSAGGAGGAGAGGGGGSNPVDGGPVGGTGGTIPPGTSPVGGPCVLPGDCEGPPMSSMITGPVCYTSGLGFPDGYCALRNCDASAQNCPMGAVCVSMGGGGGPGGPRTTCLAACDAAGKCRPGYHCATFGMQQGCWYGCTTDTDCPGGQKCEMGTTTGLCKDVTAMHVGSACHAASDCAGDGCISEKDYGYPYGYCSDSCMGDQSDCDGGLGVCVGGGGPGNCMKKCDSNADCRPGYECTVYGRGRTQKWCDAHCTLDSQCENMSCHAGTGSC